MGLTRISHTFLLHDGQVLAWLRQTAQFDPQRMHNTHPVKLLVFLARQGLTIARDEKCEKSGLERSAQRTHGDPRAGAGIGRAGALKCYPVVSRLQPGDVALWFDFGD